jgi:Sulfotransferase family
MLSSSALLDEARRQAGLDNYGDMTFAEGLRVLIDSVNNEARLSEDNEAALHRELVKLLVNRLRMQLDIKRHPEILDEQLLAPVFITSLPRTGSTKLHRLLAATGNFNALKFWHTYNFARIPDSEGIDPDPRIADTERYLQWLYRKAPRFQAGHPMYTEEAEEELALLDAGFNSLYRWAALLDVPGYVNWVLARDGLQCFRDLRRTLQYLQWQHFRGRNRRWVLKTPSLFGLEQSFATIFPHTDFIVCHRHPDHSVASASDLLCGTRETFSEADFSAHTGAAVLYNFGEKLKGHLAWRAAYPPARVLDVRFADINRDEIALLERIHAHLGIPLTDTAKSNVRAWIAMDAKREHTRSSAKLEHYGLSPAMVHERMRGYFERYAEFL